MVNTEHSKPLVYTLKYTISVTKMRLTELAVKRLAAPEKGQRSYFDDALPGFGVRISQGGTRSFIVMYGEKRQLKTLGRYPSMSLADARREAKRVQGQIAIGKPLLTAEAERITFNDARERFLTDCASRNRPRTVYDYRRLLERHFSFDKHLSSLIRRDFMQVISKLSATPAEQKYAYVAARTMLNWCVQQGYIDVSPLPRLTFVTQARERILSETELVTIYRHAAEYPYPFGPIIKLLILTGQRRGEIAALERQWIDGEGETITLPSSSTKNKRTHTFPFADLTAAAISRLPEIDDRHLFPARTKNGTCFNGWSKTKKRFDSGLDNVEPYTLHDLRRTFSSTHAQLGTPIHVTEKLLNHVSGTISGVAAVYNRHSYLDEMRTAVEAYETHLAKIVSS